MATVDPGPRMLEGYTKFDAIRLIENNNGLFIKLNDPTFSRSYLQHGIGQHYLRYTMVMDCRDQLTTSTANLERTIIKFSPSVLPYTTNRSGNAVLSSNNQVMTITVRGICGSTYFDDIDWNNYASEVHLLPVTF